MKQLQCLLIAVGCLFVPAGCSRSARAYVERGDQFSAEGKYADAALNYRRAIQKDARYGPAYLALGKMALKQGQWRDAYDSLTRAEDLLPNNTEVAVLLGDLAVSSLVQDQRHPQVLYDQVAKLRDAFLTKDPNSFDGLRWKGYLELVDRKPQEAIESLGKAHQLKPNDTKVATALAQGLLQVGREQEAERLALEQIAKDKTTPDPYDVLYWYYRSHKRTGDAESILKQKVANMPGNVAYVLELAGHYYQVQNTAEMNRWLGAFVQDTAKFPLAPLQAGDFYARIGANAEALRLYEMGAKADSKNERTYKKRIANILVATGRIEEARAMVDSLYRQDPKDAETLSVRASIESKSANTGDISRSAGEFQSLIEKKPNDPALRIGLAQALLKEGNLDGARKEYQMAAKLQPGNVFTQYALADIAIEQHNAAEVLRIAKELIRLDPSSMRAESLYATGLAGTGSTDLARKEFYSLLRRNPGDAQTRFQLVLLEIQDKHLKEAEDLLKSSGQPRNQSAELLIAWTELRMAQGQPKEALALLREAVSKQTGDIRLRGVIAKTASSLGQPDIAIEQYQYVLGKKKAAETYLQLGEVQESKGDIQAALQSYQQAKQVAPADARVELHLAHLSETRNQTTEAIQHYNTALQLDPNNAAVLNNLAFLLADTTTDVDRALELALKARQKLPGEAAISDTVGYAYLKKGMGASSVQIFSSLVQKYPYQPTYRYHLAMALIQTGNRDRARRELTECLKAKQPEPLMAKVNALLKTIN